MKRFMNFYICACIFIFFFIQYYIVHPIFPFDSDDWFYLVFHRNAMPIWGEWNPTKGLAETLQPLCSAIAGYVVYPIIKDYIDANALVYAITKAGFITMYVYVIKNLLSRYIIIKGEGWISVLLFLLTHYLVMSGWYYDNDSLLHEWDATCMFNYTIPSVFCFCFAIYILLEDDILENLSQFSSAKETAILFLIYWVMMAGFYSNIIFMSVVGVKLLCNLWNSALYRNFRLMAFAKYNRFKLILVIIWFVLLFFEYNGGRSTSLIDTSQENLFVAVSQYMSNIKYASFYWNFIGGMILCIFTAFFIIIKALEKRKQMCFLQLLLAIVITFVFVLLLESKAHPNMIIRGVVAYPFLSFFIFLFVLSVIELSNKFKYVNYILPILLCVSFSTLLHSTNMLKDLHQYDKGDIFYSPTENRKIIKHIVTEITQASEIGKDSVAIVIPKYDGNDNWPLQLSNGYRISDALYRYRIIDRKVVVSFEAKKDYTPFIKD